MPVLPSVSSTTAVCSVRTTGGGPGEFRNIGDMEYTSECRDYPELLIFSEWENHRIQVFSLN